MEPPLTSSATPFLLPSNGEVYLTPEQAALKNAQIGKGYAYAPVVVKEEPIIIEGKRERKRVVSTPIVDSVPKSTKTPGDSSKKRKAPSDIHSSPAFANAEIQRKEFELKEKLRLLQEQLRKVQEAANVSASTPLPADEPTKSSKKAKHAKESAYSTPRVSATGRARRIAAPDHFHFEGGVVESEAQQLIRCRRLIEALVKLPKAKMFSAPVDWQTYGLLDYPRIVPHPMDLGTIRRKMECQEIASVDEFCRLVRLVWGNAFRYNPYTDPVFVLARDLAEKFEADIHKIRHPDLPPWVPSNSHAPATPATATPSTTARKSSKSKTPSVSRDDFVAPTPKSAPAPTPAPPKVFTYEDRQNLRNAIMVLATEQPDKLYDLLSIIQEHSKEPPAESEELVLDLEVLEPAALFALQRYVQRNTKATSGQITTPTAASASASSSYAGSGGSGYTSHASASDAGRRSASSASTIAAQQSRPFQRPVIESDDDDASDDESDAFAAAAVPLPSVAAAAAMFHSSAPVDEVMVAAPALLPTQLLDTEAESDEAAVAWSDAGDVASATVVATDVVGSSSLWEEARRKARAQDEERERLERSQRDLENEVELEAKKSELQELEESNAEKLRIIQELEQQDAAPRSSGFLDELF